MIEVAVKDLSRTDLAEQAYALGLSALEDDQARKDLAVMYRAIISLADKHEPTRPAKIPFIPRADRQD